MKTLLSKTIRSKKSPFVAILLLLSAASYLTFVLYLKHIAVELVENWMRIEELSIQQGNIFSAISSNNRLYLSSGLIKSVMLFEVQPNSVVEMASFGEHMDFLDPNGLEPGQLKTRIDGAYSTIVFVRFKERPDLLAVFKIESPSAGAFFASMFSLIVAIFFGFSFYVRLNDRREEAMRVSLIKSALDDILEERSPGQLVIENIPLVAEEWKSLRKRFEILKEQLESSTKNRVVAQTAAMLAHDLRAPVSAFERLLFLSADDSIHNHQEIIRESLHRLHSMLDALRNTDVENIVRPTRTRLSIALEPYGLERKAQALGIAIEVHSAVPITAAIDPAKFERSWVNLLSNAIDFADSKVVIDVEVNGSNLVLRVSDDGPGVPADFLPKLFQRGATHGKADGTGLGLAYVRQIMRGHGGDITYRRDKGLTIFECFLPNAVESEEDQLVGKSATLEMQLLQKIVKKVAICLEPDELSESVLAKLASHKSDEFMFVRDRADADIVVSNIESIMFEVLESDDQEHVSVATFRNNESWIVDILILRFKLMQEVSGA